MMLFVTSFTSRPKRYAVGSLKSECAVVFAVMLFVWHGTDVCVCDDDGARVAVGVCV